MSIDRWKYTSFGPDRLETSEYLEQADIEGFVTMQSCLTQTADGPVPVPKARALVWRGQPLGAVGRRYAPLQNVHLISSMKTFIEANSDAQGYISRIGRNSSGSAVSVEATFLKATLHGQSGRHHGVGVRFTNWHAGRGFRVDVVLTNYVCLNQLALESARRVRAALASMLRVRHSGNVMYKAHAMASRAFDLLMDPAVRYEQMAKKFATLPLTDGDAKADLEAAFLATRSKTEGLSKRALDTIDDILWRAQNSDGAIPVRGTVQALVEGLTDWSTHGHMAPIEGAVPDTVQDVLAWMQAKYAPEIAPVFGATKEIEG